MSSNTLAPCPDCGHFVSQLAETCPSCARPLRKPAAREGLFLKTMNVWVAVILGAIALGVAFVVIVPLFIAVAAYVTTWLAH
jgi:hypothetical protein